MRLLLKRKLTTLALLLAGLLYCQLSDAGVTARELQRLERDLTPVGAERAGNASGTIPPWTGGLAQQAMDPAVGYLDPYADDPILFTIDAADTLTVCSSDYCYSD